MPIDPCPAALHHGDFGVGEVVHHLVEDAGRRGEVGVKDGDEFARRALHPFGQRSRFEAFAIRPVVVSLSLIHI